MQMKAKSTEILLWRALRGIRLKNVRDTSPKFYQHPASFANVLFLAQRLITNVI